MIWNDHSKLKGSHALLGASQYRWVNYENSTDAYDALVAKLKSQYMPAIGTILHEYAAKRITYNMKLKKQHKDEVLFYLLDHGISRIIIDIDNIYPNLMTYVNDGIGYKMTPEQILYYSSFCYGTADAISFRDKTLRIHDYKSGITPAHMEQLLIYVALFCLEYKHRPGDISIETRIYQNNEIIVHNPTEEDILPIMERITLYNKMYDQIKEG